MVTLAVTGSRDWPWDQRLKVFQMLNRAALNASSVTLMQGCCPVGTDIPGSLYKGVDGLSELHGRLLNWEVLNFPPDPSTGLSRPRQFAARNQQMVDRQPDKVLAFYLRGAENKGTDMTVRMAEKKGLWVLRYYSD